METIEIEIYSFDELKESAKDKARAWMRDGFEYHWWDEAHASIKAFADHFNITISDWSIGSGSGRDYIRTDVTNANFRGVKLADIKPDYMPTGYCLDATIWPTFCEEFKRTGDAKYAFEQALEQAIVDINNDIEYQYSDEAIDELLTINEYKFLADGKVWA